MRIAFFALIILHGLIYIGFTKALEPSDIYQLTRSISKPFGVIWLLFFVSFKIAAIMFAFRNN